MTNDYFVNYYINCREIDLRILDVSIVNLISVRRKIYPEIYGVKTFILELKPEAKTF